MCKSAATDNERHTSREEMSWVRWSQWDAGGIVGVGQMPVKDIQKNLQAFEKKAKEILDESRAAHVVYGVKEYNEDGTLNEVRFYLRPMDEQEFERVANISGVQVYALHALR